MKRIISFIWLFALLFFIALSGTVEAQVTDIRVDWENGAQYYYFIDGDNIKRIVAYNDTLPGFFEWWEAIDQWVPMDMDREKSIGIEFDPTENIMIADGSETSGSDSSLVAMWYAHTGLDTTFTATFIWDDTLGGAFEMLRIGTADDSTKLIRSGAAFHPDTVGGKRIYGVIDIEFPDTTNGFIVAGLVESVSFGAISTTDGIFLAKRDDSNKLMIWKVRNGNVDSATVVSNIAVNTRYRIGIYDNGEGNTSVWVNGVYTAAVTSFTPWDEDLTVGVLWKTSDAGALKTGRIFYMRFKQLLN